MEILFLANIENPPAFPKKNFRFRNFYRKLNYRSHLIYIIWLSSILKIRHLSLRQRCYRSKCLWKIWLSIAVWFNNLVIELISPKSHKKIHFSWRNPCYRLKSLYTIQLSITFSIDNLIIDQFFFFFEKLSVFLKKTLLSIESFFFLSKIQLSIVF